MKPIVLHVCEQFDPGGVTWWLLDVLPQLQSEYRFACVKISEKKGLRYPEAEQIFSAGIYSLGPSVGEIFLQRKFRKLAHELGADVVHSHVFNLTGAVLASLAGTQTIRIAHFHNTHDGMPAGLARSFSRRALRLLTSVCSGKIVGCSASAAEAAPPHRGGVQVLHYGMNLPLYSAGDRAEVRRELALEAGDEVLIHVGRFYDQKNHSGLVRIFRHVVERRPNAKLILVGDGPLRPEITQLVERERVASRVVFLGQRKDVRRLLSGADVFVFPSKHEGLGIVLLEARSAGLPVLASDIAPHREALVGAAGHALIDYRDEKAFATAVLASLDSGRQPPPIEWLTYWSVAAGAQRLHALYQEMLQH